MITNFILGLSDHQRKLLGLALAVVAVALFDRLLIGPTVGRLSAIDEDIAHEENAIKQDLHLLGYKDRILKESQVMDVYLTKQLSTDEEMTAAFLKKIEALASQSNVTLVKVSPALSQQTNEYLKYQADLECSGKLADIVSFMHLADTSTDLLKVIKFNLSLKKFDTDEIKATMTIAKIVVPS